MSTIAERAELAMRLEDGERVIAQAQAAGQDISALEAHWIRMLRQYEQACREDDISPAEQDEEAMPIELVCKGCGVPFTPDRAALVAGPDVYRFCESCRAKPANETTCQSCGRLLHGTSRRMCGQCLGLAA
jgi:hypothetical protein